MRNFDKDDLDDKLKELEEEGFNDINDDSKE